MALYFSHHESLYNSVYEHAMMMFLRSKDEMIINPNDPQHLIAAENLRKNNKLPAAYFKGLVALSDQIVFTSFDGMRLAHNVAADVSGYLLTHKDAPRCREILFEQNRYILKPVTSLEAYLWLPEDDTFRWNKKTQRIYRPLGV